MTGTVTSTYFKWGTSESYLPNTLNANSNSGSFSAALGGLSVGTTYYYQACATVCGTEDFSSETQTFCGDIRSFTTTAIGWLEMPAVTGEEDFVDTFMAGSSRNYTYNYDYDTYASLWVAYPLYSATMGGSRSGGWSANPNLSTNYQINIWSSSYGVNVGSTNSTGYDSNKNIYARGHQIPDADRNNNSTMQSQTYYATNSTPQIQNSFNSGIWNSLEDAVRKVAENTDTLYVVTGAAFNKVGENKSVVMITPKSDTKQVPVPNYYWKVLLKVKRAANGTVSAASAVGVWIDHREHDDSYSNYVVSVDQIEAWTGFDFFVNLPASLESSAESNTSWSTFTSF